MTFKEFYFTEAVKKYKKIYKWMKVINVYDKKTGKVHWRSNYSTRNMIVAKQFIKTSKEQEPDLELSHKITKEKILYKRKKI